MSIFNKILLVLVILTSFVFVYMAALVVKTRTRWVNEEVYYEKQVQVREELFAQLKRGGMIDVPGVDIELKKVNSKMLPKASEIEIGELDFHSLLEKPGPKDPKNLVTIYSDKPYPRKEELIIKRNLLQEMNLGRRIWRNVKLPELTGLDASGFDPSTGVVTVTIPEKVDLNSIYVGMEVFVFEEPMVPFGYEEDEEFSEEDPAEMEGEGTADEEGLGGGIKGLGSVEQQAVVSLVGQATLPGTLPGTVPGALPGALPGAPATDPATGLGETPPAAEEDVPKTLEDAPMMEIDIDGLIAAVKPKVERIRYIDSFIVTSITPSGDGEDAVTFVVLTPSIPFREIKDDATQKKIYQDRLIGDHILKIMQESIDARREWMILESLPSPTQLDLCDITIEDIENDFPRDPSFQMEMKIDGKPLTPELLKQYNMELPDSSLLKKAVLELTIDDLKAAAEEAILSRPDAFGGLLKAKLKTEETNDFCATLAQSGVNLKAFYEEYQPEKTEVYRADPSLFGVDLQTLQRVAEQFVVDMINAKVKAKEEKTGRTITLEAEKIVNPSENPQPPAPYNPDDIVLISDSFGTSDLTKVEQDEEFTLFGYPELTSEVFMRVERKKEKSGNAMAAQLYQKVTFFKTFSEQTRDGHFIYQRKLQELNFVFRLQDSEWKHFNRWYLMLSPILIYSKYPYDQAIKAEKHLADYHEFLKQQLATAKAISKYTGDLADKLERNTITTRTNNDKLLKSLQAVARQMTKTQLLRLQQINKRAKAIDGM